MIWAAIVAALICGIVTGCFIGARWERAGREVSRYFDAIGKGGRR